MTLLTNSPFPIILLVAGCGLGFGAGIWWVHSRRVVMDRDTHQVILNTLKIRTETMDRLRDQVPEMRKVPDKSPLPDHFLPAGPRLRICVPD